MNAATAAPEDYAPPVVPNRPAGSPDWPPDPATPGNYADILGPLLKAFAAGATWRNRTSQFPVDIPWTGLPLPHIGAGAPEARLSALWRRQDRKNGRSFLETVLCLAIGLGVEQGRRLERQDQATKLSGARFHLSRALEYLEEPE